MIEQQKSSISGNDRKKLSIADHLLLILIVPMVTKVTVVVMVTYRYWFQSSKHIPETFCANALNNH